MKEEDRNSRTSQEESIESLMRLAGPREALPADVKTRLENSFRRELQLSRRRRRAMKIGAVSAIAAVLLVALMLSLPQPEQRPQPSIASIVRMTGAVLINGDASIGTAGAGIAVGTQLNTGTDGRVLLALADKATTVRLDFGTELVLQSASELLLKRGSIYIDTGAALKRPLSQLTVTTEFADITDIGTQYIVTATSAATMVAVREGIVRVITDEQETQCQALEDAAQQLSISSSLRVNSQTISKYGGQWSWIHAIAPSFNTDKRRLIEFLQWVSRETGRPLQFTSTPSEQAAHKTLLGGSLQGYSPERALVAILSTTKLESIAAQDGAILIALRDDRE